MGQLSYILFILFFGLAAPTIDAFHRFTGTPCLRQRKYLGRFVPVTSFPYIAFMQARRDVDGNDPFVHLRSLDERSERLSNLESEFLLSFWSEKLQCFQILPQLDTNRVSVTTTCITLNAIVQNAVHWQNRASWKATPGKISVSNALQSIQQTRWSKDLYQTQQIVQALATFRACDKDDSKYVAAVDTILDNRSKLSLHRAQHISAYLRHQTVRSLLAVVENDMVPTAVKGTHRIGFALERANLVAFDELCRQLAFANCGDSVNFDVIVLAYSLLSYWETSNSAFLSSFARGVVPAINIKLVKEALKVIFANQAEDGTWAKGEPINKIGDAQGKRDIGNNYVFFFDLVGALLTALGEQQPALLSPYLRNLERCVDWAEANIQQEMLPDHIDPITGRKRGVLVKGWRSNHLGDGGAVAWCTAQVFQALTSFRKLVKVLLTASILQEFGGKAAPTSGLLKKTISGRDDSDWVRLMDSDLELAGTKSSLKTVLYERLLLPQAAKEAAIARVLLPPLPSSAAATSATGTIAADSANSKDEIPSGSGEYPPLYSAILFGPPGTAKTTICTSIARYLGWHFLTIDTACFLADGLENIAARMSYVFTRLASLERTIILFDEIEEFCLDRDNPQLTMESRLLTTAMLTQLNDLRRKQQSIFLVATNRLRAFDAAVIRPGRFDMLVFVGTPNLAARMQRLRAKLQQSGLFTVAQQEMIVTTTAAYLQSRWTQLRFLSFAENDSLLSFVVDQASRRLLLSTSYSSQAASFTDSDDAVTDPAIERDSSLLNLIDEAALADKIGSVLRTATIQGAVQAEYEASEKLSRV